MSSQPAASDPSEFRTDRPARGIDGAEPPLPLRETPPDLLILDVDGVLTDNTIWLDGNGAEMKRFHVPDGTGIRRLQSAGVPVALVSGRRSAVVDARARELGIEHAYSGVKDKAPKVAEIIAALGRDPARTAYVGDDWIDLTAMAEVGLPIAVANAIPEVKAAAVAETTVPGGFGAVRQICDWILAARGEGGPRTGTSGEKR